MTFNQTDAFNANACFTMMLQGRRFGLCVLLILLICLLSSCAETKKVVSHEEKTAASPVGSPMNLTLSERLGLPVQSVALKKERAPLYSLRIKDMDVSSVLSMFSQTYKLNMIVDPDVKGTVSVDFHDLSFDLAMSAILASLDYHWQRDHNLIHVKSLQTRRFTVDYIRLVRSSSGSSQASASSGSGAESTSGGPSGSVTISQQDSVQFWDELEKQLTMLVSKKGKILINRMAGIIQVTDKHSRVEQIAQFILPLNNAIHRQVQINVKILEVTLSDDFSLGIDWSRIDVGSLATKITFGTSNAITSPAGGFVALPPALSLNIGRQSQRGKGDINSIISALSEQGNVKIISQPKVRTLNNQPAMIKVGTDRTFFRKENTNNTTTSGNTSFSTDVAQVVTEGIVLAITPQISADGWVMLDIAPVITRVSSVTEVKDGNGTVQSSAPNLDIRQTSSLVRARDGNTVIIGGLIQTTTSDTVRKVPLLGDIPGLGNLFKGVSKIKKRKELVIFLTPHLIVNEGNAMPR